MEFLSSCRAFGECSTPPVSAQKAQSPNDTYFIPSLTAILCFFYLQPRPFHHRAHPHLHMWGKQFFWRRIICTNDVHVSLFSHGRGFPPVTCSSTLESSRDVVPSMSQLHLLVALKAFGVFLLPFLGQEKLSPLCLGLSCEIITLGQHCVPTPTFQTCNSGVTIRKKEGFFPSCAKILEHFSNFL